MITENGHPVEGICIGVTKDGKPCAAPARTSHGSQYCYQHDPATQTEREALYPQAAAHNARPAGSAILAEVGPLDTLEEILAIECELVEYLATGTAVEPKRVSGLKWVITDLRQNLRLKQRLTALERENRELVAAREAAERETERYRAQRLKDREEIAALSGRLEAIGRAERDKAGARPRVTGKRPDRQR
jgi:hypothetical protein